MPYSLELKYGVNSHQKNAYIISKSPFPFEILNGHPGYINLLDALNARQLVSELQSSLKLPAAASFKHVSPAGAAVYTPLSDNLARAYGVQDKDLSHSAIAYIKARNADPKSSFGDFVALSEHVDKDTALFLKTCVSDGIIAPSYDDEALDILKKKKKGKYIILKADVSFKPPKDEYREVFGLGFRQDRNQVLINHSNSFNNIITKNKHLTEDAKRDLILAAITLKYTQSNSVGFALQGQMIGIGAGQQSRIDCVKLAGNKALTWYLRQHPKVNSLPFKPNIKSVAKLNAQIQYIEDDFTELEYNIFKQLFVTRPLPLSPFEKQQFIELLDEVCLSSDAFFPFRDNIDRASKFGVKYIIQPGGSVQDNHIIDAANDYNMCMCFNGIRLFHH